MKFGSLGGFLNVIAPSMITKCSKCLLLAGLTITITSNNGLTLSLQRLRCRVNFQGLKFTPQLEALGSKLVRMLQQRGPFVALHLRYEMDMLAFSGCTHGCSEVHISLVEREIVSEERRAQGLCPLTPEEVALVLKALGFDKNTQIYIAAGEIYGGGCSRFHGICGQQHFYSIIPTYDGNMAKVVEGHRRYLGFKKRILLDRKRLVELLDLHDNKTLTWDQFAVAVKVAHERRTGAPTHRRVVPDKPKDEDYFYANPQECLCEGTNCHELFGDRNSSLTH